MLSVLAAALAAANSGPVIVEIVATGHIETPADTYRISGSVLACATTQAEADAGLVKKTAAIERSMAALGVRKADTTTNVSLADIMGGFRSGRPASECNFDSAEEAVEAADVATTAAIATADDVVGDASKDETVPKVGASANLLFDAPDPATATRAIAALKAADAKPGDKVVPLLRDETSAKRAAKQQALTKARAEADAYSGPLGSGRATLVKISERQDLGSLDFMGQILRRMGMPGAAYTDKVVTDVTLTVEFRLDGR